MRSLLLTFCAFSVSACLLTEDQASCPDDSATDTRLDPTDSSTDPLELTDTEVDALATWMPHTVDFLVPDRDDPTVDVTVTGNRISILVDRFPEELDYMTTLTRAQDYNSSRSNNSGAVEIDNGFGDGTGCCLPPPPERIVWGSMAPCGELPCLSGGRDEGGVSRARIDTTVSSTSTDTAARFFRVGFGETTPMDIDFTGFVALACKKCTHRGHVTVLKASSTAGGDGVAVTSAAPWKYMAVYAPGSDSPLYEATDAVAVNPLAMIAGSSGDSWPNGIEVEESPVGTLVSFTW